MASPVLGGLRAATGLTSPQAADRFSTLLGAAAGPCALVTIRLFLARQRERADPREVGRSVVSKLLVQPLLTTGASWSTPMPKPWFDAGTLLAALPTGPFMLAKLHERVAPATSRAILPSTVLSVTAVSPPMAASMQP